MHLFFRRPPPPPRGRVVVPGPVPDPAPADDRPAGCGWFDSSHDLLHGLRITEHAEADAVVNLVPLSWWLAWELDAALAATADRPPA